MEKFRFIKKETTDHRLKIDGRSIRKGSMVYKVENLETKEYIYLDKVGIKELITERNIIGLKLDSIGRIIEGTDGSVEEPGLVGAESYEHAEPTEPIETIDSDEPIETPEPIEPIEKPEPIKQSETIEAVAPEDDELYDFTNVDMESGISAPKDSVKSTVVKIPSVTPSVTLATNEKREYIKDMVFSSYPNDRITLSKDEFDTFRYRLIRIIESTYSGDELIGLYHLYKFEDTNFNATIAFVKFDNNANLVTLHIIDQTDVENKRAEDSINNILTRYKVWLNKSKFLKIT